MVLGGVVGSPARAAPAGYPVSGIDVSAFQGEIDWAAVAAGGAKFAYIRASEQANIPDSYFGANYLGAKANGLVAGAYHRARPDLSSGKAQADFFLDHAQYVDDGRTLPPMLDIEWPRASWTGLNACYNLTPVQLSAWIRDFVAEVASRTSRPAMIYTNTNWWNPCTNNNASFGSNPLFIAGYTPSPPPLPAGWTRWTLWQYSDSGTLPGDQDVFNGDYAALTRLAAAPRDISDPSAVTWAAGRLDVFARDRLTNELVQDYYSGGWRGWRGLGLGPSGHAIGPPTVASWERGRLDVFAVDQVTGRLLQRTFQNGWGNWVGRGLGPAGHRLAAPAAVSWSSGRIDVLARDEVNDDLVHFWQSGTTWQGPQRLAAGPGGDYSPSVASWGSRRLDIFAVTSSGSLAQFWFDGSRWHGWSAKGRGPGAAALIQPAAVAAWGPGRLDVFALVTGGQQVAHWWFDAGAWRGLQGLSTGGIPMAGLTATSWGSRRLDVFTTDQPRHDLMQLYFDGHWHGPIQLL